MSFSITVVHPLITVHNPVLTLCTWLSRSDSDSHGHHAQETTNEVFDKSLYDKVTHRSILSYQKVFTANLLSVDGRDWVEWSKVRGLKNVKVAHDFQEAFLAHLSLH